MHASLNSNLPTAFVDESESASTRHQPSVIPGVSLTVLRSFLLSKSTLVALAEPFWHLNLFASSQEDFH